MNQFHSPINQSYSHSLLVLEISREQSISCDWNVPPAREAGLTGHSGYKQFLLLSVAGAGEAVSCTASFYRGGRLLHRTLDSVHTQPDKMVEDIMYEVNKDKF